MITVGRTKFTNEDDSLTGFPRGETVARMEKQEREGDLALLVRL